MSGGEQHGDLSTRIMVELKRKFRFKSEKGKWLQQGECPDCHKWEVYCAADAPKVVKCSRIENCGYEETVRAILPDLFEDWSKRAPSTPEDPNATADAYLRTERGLDLSGLRGAFSQETYFDRKRNIGSATVRFDLPNNSWWERIIDRPGRFERKANFKFGGQHGGHWWAHPDDGFAELAGVDEIWLAEGIFDALALRQTFLKAEAAKTHKAVRRAVSLMSVNNWPEHALEALAAAIRAGGSKTHKPRLIFAFDVGKAGVEFTKKFVKQARRDGWPATAAQVRPDGEGTKQDWNDLLLRHLSWRDEPEKAPLSEASLEAYIWNGEVTIAETVRQKARLIQKKLGLRSFDVRFDNRIHWAKETVDKEDGSTDLIIEEVANCAFRILYRERDDTVDETNYFIQIDFPGAMPTAKARFTAACCSASSEFKKRLFAFSGMWSGTQDQLDRLMRAQTRYLKTVEPLHFTGYSATHKAWVLGDIAVRDGRVIPINKEACFDFGKQAVKLRTTERMLDITYDPDTIRFDWVNDLWLTMGPRGFVVLAFFTMSLFAQQIRAKQNSLGFLEVTGEPGSGKTMLLTFMWKLLGRLKYEGLDPNRQTVAGLARNMIKVANLPVGLIEGNRDKEKGSHGRQFDFSELLTLYDGRSPRGTGVKSSGTETFEPPFLGSIYLTQNERIDAMDAVLERLMSFKIDKGHRTEETRAAADRIGQWPMEELSGYIVHVTRQAEDWLKFYFERSKHHIDTMKKRVPDLHNDRCVLNHSQLAAAVESLAKLLPVKPEWIAEAVRLIDAMALDRQHATSADHPLVRRFWEQVEYLISLEKKGDDEARPLNQHRKAELGTIAINFSHFEERARNHGQTPIQIDLLQKLLPGSRSYQFIGKKNVNCTDGEYRFCWIFQKPKPAASSPDSVI